MSLPNLTLDPPTFYAGQKNMRIASIVEGATIHVSELNMNPVGTVDSWPVTEYHFDIEGSTSAPRLGRPLNVGERLRVSQTLCSQTVTIETLPSDNCERLPPPRIAPPMVGNDFVIVTQSLPGATIRVWSQTEEIGDGTGPLLRLKRPLILGENLRVVQQFNDQCVSEKSFSIDVQ